TYLSSARKFYIASNRDLIISTDTAMGAQMLGPSGGDVDTVDFNEHPTDKLRSKLDRMMKRVTPEEEPTNLDIVASALASAAETLASGVELLEDMMRFHFGTAWDTDRFQDRKAKEVEKALKTAKEALGFTWEEAHFAKRADEDEQWGMFGHVMNQIEASVK